MAAWKREVGNFFFRNGHKDASYMCSQIYTKSVPVPCCSPKDTPLKSLNPIPPPPLPFKEKIADVRYSLSTSAGLPKLPWQKRKGRAAAANEHAMRLQHATSLPLKGFGRGTPPSRGRVRAACRPVCTCTMTSDVKYYRNPASSSCTVTLGLWTPDSRSDLTQSVESLRPYCMTQTRLSPRAQCCKANRSPHSK
jgi:hypothetical protein